MIAVRSQLHGPGRPALSGGLAALRESIETAIPLSCQHNNAERETERRYCADIQAVRRRRGQPQRG